jgi:methionyl-tRNA formyltransferase
MKSHETTELIASYKADIFVVVAYGRILPKAIIEMPPLGCVNVHASLLPK